MTNRKYSQNEIVSIFAAIAAGWSKDRVMAYWNLTNSQLRTVIYRQVAKDAILPADLVEDAQRIYRSGHRPWRQGKLTSGDIRDILDARAAGVSLSALARLYGVSPSLISRIGSGQRGKGVRP